MARVSFDEDRCKGCGLCVTACPKHIVAMAQGRINKNGFAPAECIDQAACIGCAMCATMCPDIAITVEK